MIGRRSLGRAPLLAWKSFPARGSFSCDHRCSFTDIDGVNIRLTDVAFASRDIFTLSILGSATQARGRFRRASNIAIATRFRDPGHAPQPPGPGSLAAGSSPRGAGRNVVRLPREAGDCVGPQSLAAALRALRCRRQFRNPAIWPVEGNSCRCHIATIHSSWRDGYGRTRQPPYRIL